MNFFEQELKKLFEQNDARFVGRTCYLLLQSTNRAKIEFITNGVSEKYEGIKATMINPRDGVIDSATIYFADLFGVKQGRNVNVVPHIWQSTDGKHEWYGYKPSPIDYRIMAEAVNDYLDVYRDHVLGHVHEPEQRMEQQIM